MIETKDKAQKLKKMLEMYLMPMTENTMVEVVIKDTGTAEHSKYTLQLQPAGQNRGTAFYFANEVVDFCRGHELSNYIGLNENEMYVVCNIF